MKHLKIFILLVIVLLSCNGDQKKNHIDKNDIDQEKRQVLSQLDDNVYINIYMTGDLSKNLKKLQSYLIETIKVLEGYSNIDIDYSMEDINELYMSDNKLNPLDYMDIYPMWIKDSQKINKTYPYAVIHYKERTLPILLYNKFIPIKNDTLNDLSDKDLEQNWSEIEHNLIEAIYLLKEEKKKKIAFLQGHGELDSINTYDIRNTLSHFYQVEPFNLTEFFVDKNGDPDINKQINRIKNYKVVIIAKPTIPFSDLDKFIIDHYIMSGGKVIWMLEGTTADMNNFNGKSSFLIKERNLSINDLLSNYGAKIEYNLIEDKICNKSPVTSNNEIAYIDWKYNPKLIADSNNIINNGVESMLTNFVSSITILNKDKTTTLLTSSNQSTISNLGKLVKIEPLMTVQADNKNHVVGVLIEDEFKSFFYNYTSDIELDIIKRSKKNKMIIISDGDIIKNRFSPPNIIYPLGYCSFERNIFEGNTNFILNAVQFLCEDSILINLKYKK